MAAAAPVGRRVLITGIGIVSPLGIGTKETWKALLKGEVGVRALGAEDNIPKLDDLPAKIAATVDKSLIKPPPGDEGTWSRISPFIRYAMIAAHQALQQAQWQPHTASEKERSGCYIATGIGCLEEIIDAWKTIHDPKAGVRRLSPHFVPKILGNLATGNVSIRYGLQGPNHASITACASGAHAIGDSFRMIKYGDADVMVTGGTEACMNEVALAGFSRLRALSTKYNGDPASSASRPFDVDRDGFVMGEGAAVLVLEERDHAEARGATPIAEIVGYGMAGDAHHITAPSPDGSGALRSMKAALRTADLKATDLDHINAHATSTPVGDGIEARAIDALLKAENSPRTKHSPLYVSSTKGATGHLLGAAGAIEAAFTALALQDGLIPATANLHNPDPEAKDWKFQLVGHGPPQKVPDIRYAMSNSFGFGGINVSLILGRAPSNTR